MKEIDLKKSVYELTETYPELIGILKELGFWEWPTRWPAIPWAE